MERLTKVSRSLRSSVSSFAPNVLQLGSLVMGCVAAYDVARVLGDFAVAVCLGLVGSAMDKRERK